MQAVADQLDLDVLNPAFEKQSAQQIIDWSYRQFSDDLVMTSSMGDQAIVLIHLATQIKPDIKIIFVDTGYLFPETHLYMEQIRQRFNLNVWTYHPLIEKGYLSIACNPLSCTRPVQIGEDPRSGRWAGTGKLECGINSLDSANL